MSLVNNLLQSAAIIRDATQEGENTATRVGGFLVSLVQAIAATLPEKTIDADVISTQSTDTSFIISLRTKDSDGMSGTKQITIPICSTATAGLMSPTDRANVATALENAAQALLKAGTAMADADAASEAAATANATAVAASEVAANVQSGLDALAESVGAENGIAPLDEDGKVASEFLPLDIITLPTVVGRMDLADIDNLSDIDAVIGRLVRVEHGGVAVGWLAMSNCYGGNVVNQTIVTYLPLTDGGLDTAHSDNGAIHIYKRTFAKTSPITIVSSGEAVDVGSWSRWEEIAGDGVLTQQRLDHNKLAQLAEEFEGYSPIGNDFNIYAHRAENHNPNSDLGDGTSYYDTLATAIRYAFAQGVVNSGVHITFATEHQKWQNYSFVGGINASDEDKQNPENWKAFGGGATVGNVINVNEIKPKTEGYYTLSTAFEAIDDMALRTPGRKITFMSAANKWQTWQFKGGEWAVEANWAQDLKGVSFNGATAVAPNAEGVVEINYSVNVDDTLNVESDNPISNKAVTERINEVEKNIPSGLQINGQILSLLDGEGEAYSTVTLPAGGGGGTSNPTAIDIQITSGLADTVKEGDDYSISFDWRHYNINTNVDTQYSGRAEVIVNGASVFAQDVVQGSVTIPVSQWLAVGQNSVIIKITADDGVVTQSARIKPTVVTLSLKSTYSLESITPSGAPIAFRYSVIGSGSKTVHFKFDGVELASDVVTSSGAVTVKNIPTTGLAHGAHHLEVWAERDLTANASTVTLQSNHLHYDMMITAEGAGQPIIATETADEVVVDQYDTLVIPYAAYNPTGMTSNVEIFVDGVLYQSATVDRTRQSFSYRVKGHDAFEVMLRVSNVSKVIAVAVNPAAEEIVAETDALELYLSSSGRTNSASNAADWTFAGDNGSVTAQFTNVGFDDVSGWHADNKGLVSLRLQKGGRCYIPLEIFGDECKRTGKTVIIDYEVNDCYDDSAVLISCMSDNVGFRMTAYDCEFRSAQGATVGTKFKQKERMSVGFVVEPDNDTRFIRLYIDGKLSGVTQYDDIDSFMQAHPVGITLGNSACVLDGNNIRVYNKALTDRQMVNAYIADMDDIALMFDKLTKNAIYNEDSVDASIDYNKAVEFIPCGTIIGELPKFKGDKKKGLKFIYEDRVHPEFSFTCDNCQFDVQGTSSQYYPRKNWKMKFLADILYTQSQRAAKKYALRCVDSSGNAVPQKPVKTLCPKADFAESSGTHNTGAANFINEVLVKAGILMPPQEVDPTVRTTIYGHPILLFHQESESSPRQFIGKYNLNNDKSTHETFGFENIEGFNKGMVNRDDYLIWEGTLAELNGNAAALSAAEDGSAFLMYLIQKDGDALHNHLVEYNADAGAWQDKGEMWRWSHALKGWVNNAGASFTDPMPEVADGKLVENEIECWEFLNNGHPMCLFHTSDYDSTVQGNDLPSWLKTDWLPVDGDNQPYAPYWAGAFEPRYPDNDDNNKQYAKGKKPALLKMATDWLCSVNALADGLDADEIARRDAEFRDRFAGLFNQDMALAYDNIRERLLMADQGAKNMMWAYIRGEWYLIFYDNDTILGLNNEGRIVFIAYVNPHDKDRLGKYVFNGESSVLWNMIERNFSAEKADMHHRLVTQGSMTYDRAVYWFNTTQSDMWSECVYNADSKYKYIDSFGVAGEGDGVAQNYLDIAQGSREAHRKYMLSERFAFLDAKYSTGTYRQSYVHLRANTSGESSVPHDVAVNITAAQDWYFGFRFSGNAGYQSQYVAKGETRRFTAPEGANPNDTECYIHQADRISSLGDLSLLYPSTLIITSCKMLETLKVGNATEGYVSKLGTLTLGTHPLLRSIDITNCQNLTSSLDVTGCTALTTIAAKGSGITAVNLAVGTPIESMSLPSSVTLLSLKGLPEFANDGLEIDGYSSLTTVDVRDCPNFDGVALVGAALASSGSALRYIHIEGQDLHGNGQDLKAIAELHRQGRLFGVDDKRGKPEIYTNYELTDVIPAEDIVDIEAGLAGVDITITLATIINAINAVNGGDYSGAVDAGVEDEITLDNVINHIRYYNGESDAEAIARFIEENY